MTAASKSHAASAHWRGHVLLFDAPRGATYSAATGLRLLLVFALLEWVVGPRFALFDWLGWAPPPMWVRVPLQLAAALLLVRTFARLPLAELGLRPWRAWSATEKSYFFQVVVIANVVFAVLYGARMRAGSAEASVLERVGTVFLPCFLWGFYQEVMYRGILQTELARRLGPLAAIVIANLLYTFGPLHFYHFAQTPQPLLMFAGIFAIGLLFALLYWRSGNLWIVAVMHGIGNVYIVGSSLR